MRTRTFFTRRWLIGSIMGVLCAPVFASEYKISLFEGATGTGAGSFEFVNGGSSGTAPAILGTNASSSAGALTFNGGSLDVVVAEVNFNDGKSPANQITGKFVEGLTGSLTTPISNGLSLGSTGCQGQCFFRISFAFVPNANPNNALKTYALSLVRRNGTENVLATVNGTYGVRNVLTIPEPGSIALLGLGLVGLAWFRFRSSQAT